MRHSGKIPFRGSAAALLVASVAGSVVPAAHADPAAEQRDVVLFSFDDQSLPWRDNLKLTLERPKKHPANPVLPPGPPGSVDHIGAILYGTAFHDGGRFRMWYIAWPQPDPRYSEPRLWRPIAYAESSDGIHWEKPNLRLVEFRGSKDNNLVSIEPAGDPLAFPYDFVSVIRDDADPDPARRYKMAYITVPPRTRHGTTATATSPDGLRWTLARSTEFTRGHFENTSLIRFQGLYYAGGQNLGRAGAPYGDGIDLGRVMTVFFSSDFAQWSSGRSLAFFRSHWEPHQENHGNELHMGAGLWNRGNVVVGLYGRWDGRTISNDPAKRRITPVYGLKMDLGLVISNDAAHYREPVQNFVVVPHGSEDDWDSEAILQAQAFHNTDTETYIWYSHWYTKNPFPLPPAPEKVEIKPQGVGLLTMRRDGFGFLSKQLTDLGPKPSPFNRTDTSGSVLSKPLMLARPSRLVLNVDHAAADAPLRVSLVDDSERPLAGYEPFEVKQSGVRAPAGLKDVPAGLEFRVRVEWPPGAANPRLYAIYLATIAQEKGSERFSGRNKEF